MKKRGKNENKDVFSVRFSEKERDYLNERSKEEGISASEYIRRCVYNKPFDYIVVKQVDNLIYEVNRIGNNINQIAHNANSGYYNEAEARRLLANVEILKDLVRKAAEKIGNY